jgi:parvulin-like peptidyl-prolyl isomerase
MKRSFLVLLAASLPLVGLSASAMRIDGVAAYVNTHVITVSDVLKSSRDLQEQVAKGRVGEKLNVAFLDAVNQIIARKLIVDDYDNQKEIRIPDSIVEERVDGVINDMFDGSRAKLLAALSQEGMSESLWRQQLQEKIVVNAMRNLRAESKVSISPLAVRQRYDNEQDRYITQPKVKLAMIVIAKGDSPEEEAAKRAKVDVVLAALKDGSDFAELAREDSEDSRAAVGGSRGWMEREMLRADLADIAFSIAVGSVSDAVDIGKQFCIIKVEDRVESATISFDKVQSGIERELRNVEARELYDLWIARLRKNAYIKIVDESPF